MSDTVTVRVACEHGRYEAHDTDEDWVITADELLPGGECDPWADGHNTIELGRRTRRWVGSGNVDERWVSEWEATDE